MSSTDKIIIREIQDISEDGDTTQREKIISFLWDVTPRIQIDIQHKIRLREKILSKNKKKSSQSLTRIFWALPPLFASMILFFGYIWTFSPFLKHTVEKSSTTKTWFLSGASAQVPIILDTTSQDNQIDIQKTYTPTEGTSHEKKTYIPKTQVTSSRASTRVKNPEIDQEVASIEKEINALADTLASTNIPASTTKTTTAHVWLSASYPSQAHNTPYISLPPYPNTFSVSLYETGNLASWTTSTENTSMSLHTLSSAALEKQIRLYGQVQSAKIEYGRAKRLHDTQIYLAPLMQITYSDGTKKSFPLIEGFSSY